MCILQGFSRLIVGFDVQDWFPWESLSVENYCFKERFHCLIFRQWTLLWDGIFFNKSCWNLWFFLLCTLAVIMCISLLLFREHGEIYYFLSIIHKLLLLLIIAIIIIAFEVRERNPQFLWGVQCIIWVSCAINKRGFSRLHLCRHTFALLWNDCLRFASLWCSNSHGDSCVLDSICLLKAYILISVCQVFVESYKAFNTLSKILLWIKPSYFQHGSSLSLENVCDSWCMHQWNLVV